MTLSMSSNCISKHCYYNVQQVNITTLELHSLHSNFTMKKWDLFPRYRLATNLYMNTFLFPLGTCVVTGSLLNAFQPPTHPLLHSRIVFLRFSIITTVTSMVITRVMSQGMRESDSSCFSSVRSFLGPWSERRLLLGTFPGLFPSFTRDVSID